MGRYPSRLFEILSDPDLASVVWNEPECMLDPFTQAIKEIYAPASPEGLTSQDCTMTLTCVLFLLLPHIFHVEARHALMQRIKQTHESGRWAISLSDLAARFTLSSARAKLKLSSRWSFHRQPGQQRTTSTRGPPRRNRVSKWEIKALERGRPGWRLKRTLKQRDAGIVRKITNSGGAYREFCREKLQGTAGSPTPLKLRRLGAQYHRLGAEQKHDYALRGSNVRMSHKFSKQPTAMDVMVAHAANSDVIDIDVPLPLVRLQQCYDMLLFTQNAERPHLPPATMPLHLQVAGIKSTYEARRAQKKTQQSLQHEIIQHWTEANSDKIDECAKWFPAECPDSEAAPHGTAELTPKTQCFPHFHHRPGSSSNHIHTIFTAPIHKLLPQIMKSLHPKLAQSLDEKWEESVRVMLHAEATKLGNVERSSSLCQLACRCFHTLEGAVLAEFEAKLINYCLSRDQRH